MNRMLDIHRTAAPMPLPNPEQELGAVNPTATSMIPQRGQPEKTKHAAPETTPTGRPKNNRLPQFDQVMEAANLQPRNAASRFEQKDPLDKYSKGITKAVHDAYPGSAYARIKQDIIEEWRTMDGETLLAIPFESDAETAERHDETGDRVFDAVGEITQSKSYGVAAPIKKEELQALLAKQRHQSAGQKRKRTEERLPGTFLIHSLSQVHFQMLTQQTVWASQNITFRIARPEMNCPSFLFAIKGLRTNSKDVVKNCVRETWNDETTTLFIQNGIAAVEEKERNNVIQSIQSFKDSMWVEMLETKGQGGLQKPTFNVYANGNFINDTNAWSNIRTHLAGRSYHNSKFGHGRILTAPNHCGLCHGVDHPRGMCPFPDLDGWKGPNEMNEFSQRTDRYTRNSGRFPPGARY